VEALVHIEDTLRREDTEPPMQRTETEYLDARGLEAMTGTKASTWRYWASIGEGPASFRLGSRRVWKRSTVQAWLTEQKVHGHHGIVRPRALQHAPRLITARPAVVSTIGEFDRLFRRPG
jgi:prophage regulatory protein